MKKFVDFNINNWVKVKLTQKGLVILKHQHDLLKLSIPSLGEFETPDVDSDGYTSFQMWYLMDMFGAYIHLGAEPPFETGVKIEVAT